MTRRANHTASPPMNAATPAMVTSSPSPPAAAWASSRAFFSNVATILIILACVSILAFSLHAAARLLVRCLARRRTARAPKLPSDAAGAADGVSSAAAGNASTTGAWAEAECAICLSELADGERVSVLPACGHGFHGACVEGWLAARASCPTCRAPSRPLRVGEP
jgi:E3 ubiquitin-protein ligase ATL10/75/76/77/78